jgi:hypothetical protein
MSGHDLGSDSMDVARCRSVSSALAAVLAAGGIRSAAGPACRRASGGGFHEGSAYLSRAGLLPALLSLTDDGRAKIIPRMSHGFASCRRLDPWPATSRGLNAGSGAISPAQAPPTASCSCWPSFRAGPVTTPKRSPANASGPPSCCSQTVTPDVFARRSILPSRTGATCWPRPAWLMRTGQLGSTKNLARTLARRCSGDRSGPKNWNSSASPVGGAGRPACPASRSSTPCSTRNTRSRSRVTGTFRRADQAMSPLSGSL